MNSPDTRNVGLSWFGVRPSDRSVSRGSCMGNIKPICFFAIFADEVRKTDTGEDIVNINNTVVVVPSERDHVGVAMHKMTLNVEVLADVGLHVLSFSHEGHEYAAPSTFEILPEHGNMFILQVEREFPVCYGAENVINVFPLLLDGGFLANAFVMASSY